MENIEYIPAESGELRENIRDEGADNPLQPSNRDGNHGNVSAASSILSLISNASYTKEVVDICTYADAEKQPLVNAGTDDTPSNLPCPSESDERATSQMTHAQYILGSTGNADARIFNQSEASNDVFSDESHGKVSIQRSPQEGTDPLDITAVSKLLARNRDGCVSVASECSSSISNMSYSKEVTGLCDDEDQKQHPLLRSLSLPALGTISATSSCISNHGNVYRGSQPSIETQNVPVLPVHRYLVEQERVRSSAQAHSRTNDSPEAYQGHEDDALLSQDGIDTSGAGYQSYQRDSGSNVSGTDSTDLTRSQVLTFISLAISTFLDQVSFSVLAPFFPREAKDRGVSSLQIGFIFGAFALVNVIFCPVFGKYLPVLGAKFTLVAGIWLVAGCNVLFGFCDYISSTLEFIIFCYVIRCSAAVGTSASVTASMTIVAHTFPEHVAQAVGLLETFSGLGYMVGPVIGGFLYEVSGEDYKVPFIVLGCADMLCVFINMAILPAQDYERREPGSISTFLRVPSVWPVGLVIFVGSGAFGFLDPTLSIHVEQFTESAMVVGLMFLLAGGCYAFSSPFWGYMAEKLKITRLLVIQGSLVSAGAFLLMGPSPLLDLPNKLWIVCVSLLLAGVFLSASIISSFNDLLMSALRNGMPDDITTQALVSGVFNCVFSLGYFVGPSVGGVSVEVFGFDWSVTVLAGLQVGVAIMLALFTLGEFCCNKRGRQTHSHARILASVNQDDITEDSMEPLLKGHV